ncbi:unnamed protein product [Menidia menidia]|uniref:(Atlantic silverside) hypothetical protein n=1 Tax=Menidia menidia TaxID=238744 RepID=A0A8S4BGP1_9TELE|nr:unnamed protein product [Menidia menidia]
MINTSITIYQLISELKKLLLTPPNVPAAMDLHKDGHRYGNRSLRLRPVRPVAKSDLPLERKPRAVRPAGRLCTELHRHLTTAPPADTEEDEEEDSESEEEEEEEEEEESSGSEAEGVAVAPAGVAVAPAPPQFGSERELRSVVELITYMHTYCLPTRKQQGWERREPARRAPRPAHSRLVLVAPPAPPTAPPAPRRLPFARRRQARADSLLRDLLQQSGVFDVSQPYRLTSPPYAQRGGEGQGQGQNQGQNQAQTQTQTQAQAQTQTQTQGQDPAQTPDPAGSSRPQPCRDSSERGGPGGRGPGGRSPERPADGGSFSVRRSRRLASFPSRFAKRPRPNRPRDEDQEDRGGQGDRGELRLLPTQAGGAMETQAELPPPPEPTKPCCHEKRACLCLPLNPKPTGEAPFSTKPFEQTLSVDLCGTAEGPEEEDGGLEGPKGPEVRLTQEPLPQQPPRDGSPPRSPRPGGVRVGSPPPDCPSATPPASEEEEPEGSSRSPSPVLHLCPDSPSSKTDSSENSEICEDKQRIKATSEEDNCQVFYIHNLPSSVTQNMLRKRFQVFGSTEECKVIICNEERCGVIKIRQAGAQRHRKEREAFFQNGNAGLRRLTRKRYIDLDEAGPGPVKSKYDALDFDTLLKEAQKSLQR